MEAFLQESQRKRFVVVGSHLALPQFLQDDSDIFAVGFGIVAAEVIVACGPGA